MVDMRLNELLDVLGRDCSCNASPTLRAKLIRVGKIYCTLEITPREYSKDESQDIFIGKRFKIPTQHTHNMYFY